MNVSSPRGPRVIPLGRRESEPVIDRPIAFLIGIAVGIALSAASFMAAVPLARAEGYDELICSYSWSCEAAQAVMFCESSGRAHVSDGFNVGLFQIASRFHSWRLQPGESLYNPEVNVRIAHEIWLEQGWSPWPSCGRRWR